MRLILWMRKQSDIDAQCRYEQAAAAPELGLTRQNGAGRRHPQTNKHRLLEPNFNILVAQENIDGALWHFEESKSSPKYSTLVLRFIVSFFPDIIRVQGLTRENGRTVKKHK